MKFSEIAAAARIFPVSISFWLHCSQIAHTPSSVFIILPVMLLILVVALLTYVIYHEYNADPPSPTNPCMTTILRKGIAVRLDKHATF